MVLIKKKFFVFTVKEKWFHNRFTLAELAGFTACMHVKDPKQSLFTVKRNSFTIENNLLLSQESILAGFKKTVQTEVKQAARMNIQCRFENNPEQFEQFYNRFAVNRNIAPVTIKKLQEMSTALRLSFAYRDNELLAAHSYICDGEKGIVRLMHAASKRLDNPDEKQTAGRANKLLHFHDMCAFREEGYAIYDFGGYAMNTADRGLQGINAFKLSFGGVITECINYCSWPYVIFRKLALLFKREN